MDIIPRDLEVKVVNDLEEKGEGDDVNFRELFNKAIGLFGEQAELACKKGNDVNLTDIELTKAKANSFLDAISNVRTIKHELDIASEEAKRFKRGDELDLLNSLRIQCGIQAELGIKNAEYIQKRLISMYSGALERGEDVNVIELGYLNTMLDENINSTQKIIASTAKLIQLERYSGNRQWGKREVVNGNVNYIQNLDAKRLDEGEGAKSGEARRLSQEELLSLVWKDEQ